MHAFEAISPPASLAASNIYLFLIQKQFLFFALRAEHGHAVGVVAASVPTWAATWVCFSSLQCVDRLPDVYK
jgi:hypothetical protein